MNSLPADPPGKPGPFRAGGNVAWEGNWRPGASTAEGASSLGEGRERNLEWGPGAGSWGTAWALWVGAFQVKEPRAGAAETLGRRAEEAGAPSGLAVCVVGWHGPADRARTEEGEMPDPERKPGQRP